jgi:hypothetical protein
MGKYTELQSAIFNFFSGLTWGLESIPTYPQDLAIKDNHEKFVRISIIPSGNGINLKSASGICIIDIFTATTANPSEAMVIADKLDDYLVGGSKNTSEGVLQFPTASSLVPKGKDVSNPALIRHSYTIPFKYFGVQ